MGYGEESTAATHVPVTSCARSESGGCPAHGRVPALGRAPRGHRHPPHAADALLVPTVPLAPGDRPRGEEWPRGPCLTCAAEGPTLGGQVGIKDSNSHFPPTIFIFHVVKPWEELGGGGHVQWGEADGGSRVALCCRITAGCRGARGC